jgi:catechol 2,3-dioxygenase-like lactoylglutathione lyase family enzyme
MLQVKGIRRVFMSNQQIQKVKVKRLAHVGLWANDILAQLRFYRQILGFDLQSMTEENADAEQELEETNIFLSLGAEHHCLGLFSDTRPAVTNGRRPAPRPQLHHLSFEVDTDAELAALAARLNMSGIELTLSTRDGNPDLGDTLWFHDPDGNLVEIAVTPDDLLVPSTAKRQNLLQPYGIQHIALNTTHLETMVEFYTEALGFDISDWLLRECAWLRCNNNHHTIIFMQGNPGINHIGYTIADGPELLRWADHLGRQQVPILWGPGRHGAGNDLFLQVADAEGIHIELSAESQQFYDQDVTTPPRLWHTRASAFNLWGALPLWMREEVHIS